MHLIFALSIALSVLSAALPGSSKLPGCAHKNCAILTNFGVPNDYNITLCPANDQVKTASETVKLFKDGKTKGMKFIAMTPYLSPPLFNNPFGQVGDQWFRVAYKDNCLDGYKGVVPNDSIGIDISLHFVPK